MDLLLCYIMRLQKPLLFIRVPSEVVQIDELTALPVIRCLYVDLAVLHLMTVVCEMIDLVQRRLIPKTVKICGSLG